MPSCKQARGFREGLRLQSWQPKPPTYTAPVANSPGGRDRTVPQVAGMDAGRLGAWAVHCGLVAVFIILLAGINLTAGDQPLPVALSTGHWALRREGLRGDVSEISHGGQRRPPFSTPSLLSWGSCRMLSLTYLLISGHSKRHRTLPKPWLHWAGISKPFFLWGSQRRKRYPSATNTHLLSGPLRPHQKPIKCGRERSLQSTCESHSQRSPALCETLFRTSIFPRVSPLSLATN